MIASLKRDAAFLLRIVVFNSEGQSLAHDQNSAKRRPSGSSTNSTSGKLTPDSLAAA